MPIEVIIGPMFSGKSEELIRRVRRSIIAGQVVQVFKPAIDTRRAENHVTTYDGVKIEAIPVSDSKELYSKVKESVDVVAIDELQFFDEGIIEAIEEIEKKATVIVSCLNLNFRGEAFPFKNSQRTVAELALKADSLDKLSSICTFKAENGDISAKICGGKAIFSQRIIDGKPAPYDAPIILLGSQEAYEARCRKHYQIPGKPDSLKIDSFLK
ncbi:MAG TPA: thymidine kinase [archaeon]|nr:thymidine kinase [archaeon]